MTIDSSRNTYAAAVSENPDVILLDLIMPVTDTLAILRDLKADPATASIPVIIVTSSDEPQHRQICMEGGAFDYLGGQWSLTQLRALIQMAISRL
jgi:CheY-like chemotaxis protein